MICAIFTSDGNKENTPSFHNVCLVHISRQIMPNLNSFEILNSSSIKKDTEQPEFRKKNS